MEQEEAQGPSKKPRLSSSTGGDALTAFTLRLAKKLSLGRSDGSQQQQQQQIRNVVFSPLSIYAALALVAAGARGATLDEILLLLGAASRDELAEFARAVADRVLLKTDDDGSSSSEDKGGPRVTFAGGVWHDKTVALRPAYRAAAGESYKAITRAADFKEQAEEAREEINRWVAEATNQLITSLLPPGSVNRTTRIVLANAVYFNGTWADPFARKHTTDRRFHRLDGTAVDAPFMKSKRDQFVASHDGFKVLKLPYKTRRRNNPPSVAGAGDDDEGPRLSMCVFLPDARDGLPHLVEMMAASSDHHPNFWLRDHLPTRRVRVTEFLLPKFKLSFSRRIDGVLKDMGVKAAFDAQQADLGDMFEGAGSGSSKLAVEQVFHKAVIDVNEEGTEAAAATAFIVRKMARVCKPLDFVADHPFVFFVMEEVSGAVVFAGHVLDPTRSTCTLSLKLAATEEESIENIGDGHAAVYTSIDAYTPGHSSRSIAMESHDASASKKPRRSAGPGSPKWFDSFEVKTSLPVWRILEMHNLVYIENKGGGRVAGAKRKFERLVDTSIDAFYSSLYTPGHPSRPIAMESHDASASKKPRRSAGPGSLTALTLRLAKYFAAAEQSSSTENGGGGGSKNLIFSPLSVYAALALVAAGAQGGTLDELLAALGAASRDELAEFVRGVAERALADGSGSGGPRVAFACGVWHDQTRPLKPAYRDAAVASYKATTRAVDFREQSSAAVEEINRWVAEATHNLIPKVVSPSSLNPRTRLVLTNAIYFKGKWDKPFSKDSTKVDKFHCLDGTAVDAPRMCKSRGRQLIAVHDGFKVLMLPYKAPAVGRNATTNQRRDPVTQVPHERLPPRRARRLMEPR
ncbi:hypothetical protein EJB05_44693, partial [Eragrostis curvula]